MLVADACCMFGFSFLFLHAPNTQISLLLAFFVVYFFLRLLHDLVLVW